MKCLIVIFAIAAAVQALPYYGYPDIGDYDYGYGAGSGVGSAGGSSYGNSGYGGIHDGHSDQGYHNNVFHTDHDIGHQQNDFDSSVHRHESSDHDIGGSTQVNNGGHNNQGFDGNNYGHGSHGSNWYNGMY